ncbi:MAG: anti-sigma F factor [Butyrivibrio sp.]
MNRIRMEFDAVSENERLARVCAVAFVSRLDPTLEEINDIKTAVSEAVTNCVIHGYQGKGGIVVMDAVIRDRELEIKIQDFGVGIENVEQAMEPLFTTGAENERSGMGFTFMQMFMDELDVSSKPGEGTTVTMKKRIKEETV